jgi:hypothetical protein
MKKYTWKYWFEGMKRPKTTPKGCEWYSETGTWVKEILNNPQDWSMCKKVVRRWKVAVKTCKWISGESGYAGHGYGIKCLPKKCPECGKPVEIVKKGSK